MERQRALVVVDAMNDMMPATPHSVPARPTPGGLPARSRQPRSAHRRTSVLLRDFLEAHTEPRISLGALVDALQDRGFGVLLFIFAFPNLIPLNIPFVSSVLGFPLVLLAAQLSYGRHKPWFPDWLTQQSFPREGFTKVALRALPYLERTERLLKPRLPLFVSWTAERLIGVFLLVLTIVLSLPIPLGNWLPACAISIIGLAIVEKDGLAVLVGIAVGIASLIVAWAVILGFIKAFLLVVGLTA